MWYETSFHFCKSFILTNSFDVLYIKNTSFLTLIINFVSVLKIYCWNWTYFVYWFIVWMIFVMFVVEYIWHYIVSCEIFIRYNHVIETHSSKGINHSSEIMLLSLKTTSPAAYVICCNFDGQRSLSLENRHFKVALMKFRFYFIFSYCLAMLG